MFETQFNSETIPKNTSWILDDLSKPKSQPRVIRRFINSAIYVEKTVTEMPPLRKTSPLSVTEKNEDNISVSESKTNSDMCTRRTPESGYRTNDQSSIYSSQSDISENTVKLKPPNQQTHFQDDLKLSLTSLNTTRTNRTCTLADEEKKEIVKNWMMKKECENKRKQARASTLAKEKEEEKQRLLDKERENFKRWLAEKKREEEKKKVRKEIEMKEQELREAEREKRKVENEICFNMWLRTKKKSELEKKISQKISLLHLYEEKQRRMDENERAYQEWLKGAHNRQKPIPTNRGLQTPENSCIIWKCNKANHDDSRPTRPLLVIKDKIEEQSNEPLEAKWIPVLPGIISQKFVNESKHLTTPF